MAHVAPAVISAVEAGRRRTAHRVTDAEGVRQTGTERCNIADVIFPPRTITSAQLRLAISEGRACRWCFPRVAR